MDRRPAPQPRGERNSTQAVYEVAVDIFDYIEDKEVYHAAQILRRMAEPDRVISFRVCWEDDNGNVRVQRGYRVQNNNAIGPYKGRPAVPQIGQPEHPEVPRLRADLQEQPDRPAHGRRQRRGSDFNPKGKSDNEVMRFCQSFMTELYRHVGEDTDVPAGDIGVGAREIGYMFGQYKRITNQ